MKTKRKPRNKISKSKPDLTVPISIEILGTDEDPCFGKLFDPRASECQRCGDSEICSIVMGQKNHQVRLEIEKSNNFKDMEEVNIKPTQTPLQIKIDLKLHIRKMVKQAGGLPIDMDIIIKECSALFAKDGWTTSKIKKLITKVVEKSNHITLTKNKLKWK